MHCDTGLLAELWPTFFGEISWCCWKSLTILLLKHTRNTASLSVALASCRLEISRLFLLFLSCAWSVEQSVKNSGYIWFTSTITQTEYFRLDIFQFCVLQEKLANTFFKNCNVWLPGSYSIHWQTYFHFRCSDNWFDGWVSETASSRLRKWKGSQIVKILIILILADTHKACVGFGQKYTVWYNHSGFVAKAFKAGSHYRRKTRVFCCTFHMGAQYLHPQISWGRCTKWWT